MSDANLSGLTLHLQHMIIGKQMPNYTDIQLHPHIQSNKCIKQRDDEGPMKWSYTHFHIIGTMANEWSYNYPQWANNKDMLSRQMK